MEIDGLTHTSGGPALVIRQRQGKQAEQVDAYFLEPIPSGFGREAPALVQATPA